MSGRLLVKHWMWLHAFLGFHGLVPLQYVGWLRVAVYVCRLWGCLEGWLCLSELSRSCSFIRSVFVSEFIPFFLSLFFPVFLSFSFRIFPSFSASFLFWFFFLDFFPVRFFPFLPLPSIHVCPYLFIEQVFSLAMKTSERTKLVGINLHLSRSVDFPLECDCQNQNPSPKRLVPALSVHLSNNRTDHLGQRPHPDSFRPYISMHSRQNRPMWRTTQRRWIANPLRHSNIHPPPERWPWVFLFQFQEPTDALKKFSTGDLGEQKMIQDVL